MMLATATERREADLFWADLVGIPLFPQHRNIEASADESMVGLTEDANDDIVQRLDRIAGTSYGDYAGYRATLVDGSVFGHRVRGVHPDFLRKLQAAETAAATAIASGAAATVLLAGAVGAGAGAIAGPVGAPVGLAAGLAAGVGAASAAGGPSWGVNSVGGYRASSGWHNWGLAIDLNADSAPYIIHEACEADLDSQLVPVYHRIARFMLSRDSVIPTDITRGTVGASRTARLYQSLAEESAAMISYFSLLRTPANLAARLQTRPLDASAALAFFGDATSPTYTNVLRQIMRDYVVLKGQSGPAVPGETYPTLAALPAVTCGTRQRVPDRPFAGGGAGRDPLNGFLSIRREIVVALSAQNLRWGAIDFPGGASGDIMHFDDGNGALARHITRAKRATP
jgi:hypothetical protein